MKQVDELRVRIEELRAEIERVIFAPLPRDEALQRLDTWITQKAQSLPAWGFQGIDDRGRPRFPAGFDNPLQVEIGVPTSPTVIPLDLSALLVAIAPEGVRAAIARSLPEDGPETGVAFAERPAIVRELERELLRVELEEEAEIAAAEARTGQCLERRPDARIEIVAGSPEYIAELHRLTEDPRA